MKLAADSNERWSVHTLSDGAVVRMKPVLITATRIDGQWAENGDPVYSFSSQIIVVMDSVPAELKRENCDVVGKVQ